ncbi:MAG: methionyl-tRNA formyltransferase [Lachnospiraceae bacterium]|nr:methionyl-tRNA formyltransferase [Lachnospiraceae bacterium]
MKIVFMGTPDFAVPTLDAIIKAGHEVLAVVTQPDKPKGRSGELSMSPVKEYALKEGIEVLQPVRLRKDEEFLSYFESLKADVCVVVAFGQILPKRVLDAYKYGCINVHGSLLPAYRGAAPIQWAVINGDEKSGVTIMQLDEGIDTGDIIAKKEIFLDAKETGGSLFDKLAALGGEMIVDVLKGLEEGTVTRTPQGEATTEYAKMLDKNMGKIDFSLEAKKIECLIRGLNPWPSAYSYINGKTLKVWEADVCEGKGEAGEVIDIDKNGFTVACGKDALYIKEVQLEGKKRMASSDFLRGYKLQKGDKIGC